MPRRTIIARRRRHAKSCGGASWRGAKRPPPAVMRVCPAARDAGVRGRLEALELVLAQIAQLPPGGDTEDVQLINQGLEQHSVLLRLRTANPAGPGPVRTQGAL